MILLRLISWPYARKHAFRCLLTIAGIVLGVAVFVGMHTANQSVLAAFQGTIDRIAGKAQLQVSAGEPGFDEDVLDKVESLPEVSAAAPVIEASVSAAGTNLLILGVDMLGDGKLRNYDLEDSDNRIDDPLVFFAQPDSLMVSKTFADRKGLEINSQLPLNTTLGEQKFTVRGIMKPEGLASAFGGDLAVMDIYAAQKMFGRGRKFDRVDIALQDGVSVDQAEQKLKALLGPGFQVEPPSLRGQQFEATSRVYALASDITSLFALFIGMFIIYNTFAIAVTQRRAEIGILRALGATRGQIRTLFIAESALTGLAGTALGVLAGLGLATAMAGYIGGLLEQIYGVPQTAGAIHLDPAITAAAMAMGLLTSLAAAMIPARNAARVDPVKALQKGPYQSLSESESRIRRNWALACACGSLAALGFSRVRMVSYAGALLAVLAAVLLSPAVTLWLARMLRPLLRSLRPVEGTLAADSLIQAPRRTSGSVAALMLSLALVISLGGLARASYNAIAEWLDASFDLDLLVRPVENLTNRSFVLPADLGQELARIPGVARVQMLRDVRILIGNAPVMLVAADSGALTSYANLPPVEGSHRAMLVQALAGTGAIVSENFMRLHGARFGQMLEIPSPSGVLRLRVAGVVRDFTDQQGAIMISRDLYVRHWNDDAVSSFGIHLQPGANEADVRQRILDGFGAKQRLFVMTNAEVRSYISKLTDQWFGLTYVQIAVAVLVAILGIVNALTVSITDRRRELGVLQAVGGLRWQVRHTVWIEAAAIGVIGLALGLGFGALQLYYSVEVARRDIIGIDLGYAYPFKIALAMLPVILGAAWLAALGPGEQAVRGSLVEALEYE